MQFEKLRFLLVELFTGSGRLWAFAIHLCEDFPNQTFQPTNPLLGTSKDV